MGGPGAPPPTAGIATVPAFPQMAQMGYPAAFDYSTYLDPRGSMAPVIPRPSRRSRRHRHHRSHRRSPSPSESSGSELSYESPSSSYDSYDYPRRDRHHRSGSRHNPLPRPPKDVLSSTPFRPILTQLPSAHYNSWGLGGSVSMPMSMPQPQPQPQPTTYGNIRPRKERGGVFNSLRRRDQRFGVPSLSAAARVLAQPFIRQTMPMPQAHPAPPPVAVSMTPAPVTTVIPPTPQMHMPTPETTQGPPVIPPGTTMPMPNPAPAGSTPFVTPGGLATPRTPRMPTTPGQPMQMPMGVSPASGPVQMPTPMAGTAAPMPSPMPGGGGRPQTPMPMPAPGVPPVTAMAAMSMPSPSLGNGTLPQVLKFNGYGEYAGLLCHSPHSVLYEDELYPTALHLFEAHKFLVDHPHLAERIRRCDQVEAVTAISAELADFARPDWGNVALVTMDRVLYLKFRQHSDLRTLLLNTHHADLVYVESGDPFWGDGAGTGRNELGQSLMRVREQLRAEGGM
ncbi:hypothetical protein BJV78DRAFT_231264 [Lactifluus subvellereus]|nr:hypothetical protein BJV78DRAFT_231264 [Lactifluus subvellereus]